MSMCIRELCGYDMKCGCVCVCMYVCVCVCVCVLVAKREEGN